MDKLAEGGGWVRPPPRGDLPWRWRAIGRGSRILLGFRGRATRRAGASLEGLRAETRRRGGHGNKKLPAARMSEGGMPFPPSGVAKAQPARRLCAEACGGRAHLGNATAGLL